MSVLSVVRRLLGWFSGVTRWPLWSLPPRPRAYVIAVVAVWLAASAWAVYKIAAQITDRLSTGGPVWDVRSVVVTVVLLGCGAATVEATRPTGQAAGRPWRNMTGAWTLPLVVLLPPWWALLVPPLLALWSQLRATRSLPHRVAFTVAAAGLGSAAAAWTFTTLSPVSPVSPGGGLVSAVDARWVVAAVAAGVVRVIVNSGLVAVAVRLSDPETRLRPLLVTRASAAVDLVEVSSGLTVAALCVISPWLILFTVPAMVFLVARHAAAQQLESLATTDHKTGVLTAGAWEREAGRVIARAHRDQAPLAVLMLDMDDFKQVNDTQGHLGGDVVLRLVAREIRSQLRPTDLVGRFGGDEFAVLLPNIPADAAYEVAERLRRHVAEMVIPTLPAATPDLRVTVSVGLVTLPKPRVDVTDLLTAADHALYQSKRDGRNRTSRLAIGPTTD